MITIKDLVKNNTAIFQYYRDGSLWYKVLYGDKVDVFKRKNLIFPVPIEDIGDATFHIEEKALLMMRYIKKYIKETGIEL